ncbi:MAG: tetratricopeptide repeat protein [Verrucomicrobiota bacterium]
MNVWRFSTLVVFGVWFAEGFLCGATPFESGNVAFKAGRFEEAVVFYKKHLIEVGESAELHHNMGRAYESLGDPGRAVLEWERAMRVTPKHKESDAALAATRKLTGARERHAGIWSVLKPDVISGYEGWFAALGGWIVLGAGVSCWLWRWRGAALGMGCVGLLLLLAGVQWWRDALNEFNGAIVVERVVTARSVPADSARPLGEWAAGSWVRILGQSGGWERCVLPDGAIAWLPAKSLEPIVSNPLSR